MALGLFIICLVGFFIWLLRKPADVQITSMAVLVGAIFLYGPFLINILEIPHPYGLTAVFFLAILTSIGVEKLKQVR